MNTIVIEAKQCPNCGRLMAGGPLAGLCPACLLAQGSAPESQANRAPFVPPPIDEVRKLFPQLEVVSLLGAGGMGAVYKARQPALDRWVALKILPAENSSGVNFAERFNREARALARLSHPNIVTVHEFGQAGALHFFIMEFVDGTNLRQLQQSGRIAAREALQIIPQICDALQYAHDEGVVHRDIKPENVLVDRKGRVKIADFGLAKILNPTPDTQRLTMEGQVMGTPHYMAPEQVEKPLAVDHRADIYALGVVFYEMLTGDLPLGKFPPPSRKVQIDFRLDDVVLRALENDPERRYQKVSEVKSQVESIAGTPPPLEGSAKEQGGKADQAGAALSWSEFWKGTALAVAIVFGLLTIAFGFVSALTGRSLMGWLGIIGWPSVVARLLITGLIVGWMIRAHSKEKLSLKGIEILTKNRPWWMRKRAVLSSIALLGLTWFLLRNTHTQERVARADDIRISRAATFDPVARTMTARLSGGGTVELLGVSDVDAGPEGWWSPDGKWLGDQGYEVRNPAQNQRSGRVSKDLVLRLRDLPTGADVAGLAFEPASSVASGGQVFRDGAPVSGTMQVRVAVKSSTREGTLNCGLGLKPWRTVATIDAQGRNQAHRREHGDPQWMITFHHQPTATADGAQVSLVFGPENRMWMYRLIAVDTDGVEHAANSAQGSPVEKVTLWSYTFDQLPLSRVREFQMQVRPVSWVAFANVALKPTDKIPKSAAPHFADVVEKTIPEDTAIDFDTNKTEGFPMLEAKSPIEALAAGGADIVLWMRDRGFDAAVGVDKLEPVGMDFVALRDSDWDGISAREVTRRVYAEYYRPREVKALENSRTFGFRTREHGVGILQIISTEPGKGMKLRYKMVQRGSSRAAEQGRTA